MTTFAGPSSRNATPQSPAISTRMSRTGRRDTKPELALRRELHRRGLRYRVDLQVLPEVRRRPDIVFTSAKVAVFVDGCFWHRCPTHATRPKHNAEFWRNKIETNVARDRDTDKRMKKAGWKVCRVWEHEDPTEAAPRIERLVQTNRELRPGSEPRECG